MLVAAGGILCVTIWENQIFLIVRRVGNEQKDLQNNDRCYYLLSSSFGWSGMLVSHPHDWLGTFYNSVGMVVAPLLHSAHFTVLLLSTSPMIGPSITYVLHVLTLLLSLKNNDWKLEMSVVRSESEVRVALGFYWLACRARVAPTGAPGSP